MAYCHKCGEKTAESDNFCDHCGASIKGNSKHISRTHKRYGSLIFSIIIVLIIGYIILDVWAVSQVTPVISFEGMVSSIANLEGGITLSRAYASSTIRFENPTFVPILFGRVVCQANYGTINVAEARTGFFIMGGNSQKNIPVTAQINNLNAAQAAGKGLWNIITGKTERAYIDVYTDFILFKIKVNTIG